MATKGTKLKTPIGELAYVFIAGEGRNTAMPGEPARMMFTVSVKFKKDSAEHKAVKDLIDTEWKRYCDESGVRGRPKTTGIKPVMIDKTDAKGVVEQDEYGAPIKIEGPDVLVNFSTSTKWADGSAQIVKIFDHKGQDITTAVHSAQWKIGNGSLGIIHGMACGNKGGGTEKVSLYLSAVQLAKLVKYEGTTIDAEEIEGEEIDLGDSGVPAIPSQDSTPTL